MLNKLFILLLLSTLLIALKGNGQGSFNNYYHSGKFSYANKINYINQNEFILSSYYIDSVNNQQGLDFKLLNNQGQNIKRKRYLFKDIPFTYFFPSNNVQLNISNSTMLLTGGSFIDTASAVIFTSVNKATLDTNWVRYYYDGIYNYYLNNVLKISANEVWIMGGRGNNYGYNERPVAIKIDTLGNILAIKEFTNLINFSSTSIHYDNNQQHLYIAGLNYTNLQSQESYVACLDTFGNVLWNKQIGSGPSSTYFYQIEKKNNYILLCGQTWINKVGNINNYKLSLTKLNSATGNLIWQRTHGAAALTNTLRSFVINADESIIASGSYQDYYVGTGINRNGIIFKANSDGDSLWARRYSNYNPLVQSLNSLGWVEEGFSDIQTSFDGGYIMCGVPFGTPIAQDSQAWVVKTDSLGNAPGLFVPPVTGTYTALQELGNQNELSIYPNPAADAITLKTAFALTESGYTKLSLYNHLGQLLKEEELSANAGNYLSLKTNNLSNGIYFLQLSGANAKSLSKKFVISR
jgi:hypothetical protein